MATKKRTASKRTVTKSSDYLTQVETALGNFFAKAPSLPKGVKEFIVQFGPWLMLVGLIIAIPAILAALGMSAFVAPFNMMGAYRMRGFGLQVIISTVVLIMNALALPGLFARKSSGWHMLFYSSLLQAVGSLITFDLGSLVIGSILGWYFLFQVKSYYK